MKKAYFGGIISKIIWGGKVNEVNYDEKCRSLLKKLEELERLIARKKLEISKLKAEEHISKNGEKKIYPISDKNPISEVSKQDDLYEEAIDFYLLNYRLLREGFTESEIRSLLPRRTNPDYANILLRLVLESTKEIREIKELLKEKVSLSERELCENLILHENRKIEYIRSRLLAKEDDIKEEVTQNNIILVPTLGGNIRIIDDLEHISNDYYEGFKELITSIVDGCFKNVKRLKGDNLSHIFEVKAFKIRVVFARLDENSFALITAFIKKSDTDKLYRESLISKIKDYYLIEEKLKKSLLDESFQEENAINVNTMWSILSPLDDTKTYRKENK